MRIDCGDTPIPCTAEEEGGKSSFTKYGSKIEAIVKTVLRVQDQDVGCKIICFVQWEDLKRRISSALQEFGIDHATLHGSVWARRAALMKFQYEEEGPRMLLLSLEESASGTNLTAANHVLIVHPMEAATREEAVAFEMQAIGRVRRPGQEKKIHIWRFVTMGTIEQSLTEEHQHELWERQGAGVAFTQEWADTMAQVSSDKALPSSSLAGQAEEMIIADEGSSAEEAEEKRGELSPTQVAMQCDTSTTVPAAAAQPSHSQSEAPTQVYLSNPAAIGTPVQGGVSQLCGVSQMDCATQAYQSTPDLIEASSQFDTCVAANLQVEADAQIDLGGAPLAVATPMLESLEDDIMKVLDDRQTQDEISAAQIMEDDIDVAFSMEDADEETLVRPGVSDSIVWDT